MTERELQQQGMLYKLDKDLLDAHINAMRLTRLLNSTPETEPERKKELVQELFGHAGRNAYIEPPFFCDFGYNISVGEDFFCNYDCVFLDCGHITIGDHVMIGPKVSLYTANHPIDPAVRSLGHDHGIPVTIGDRVWIGGNAVVCPGVTIGSNTVIGAGSVVTHDIPEGVVAAGNPCRVIRKITPEDTAYWQQQLARYRELCDNPLV
jgi:maltose O-acetyltransferase